MSMLGISLLNEIVGENKNLMPSEILEKLRKRVKISLKQTGNREAYAMEPYKAPEIQFSDP